MNEQFLSYLWKSRQLYPDLKTEAGDTLTILHPGDQNRDGGPDFFNARLRIGDTTWAGNVEIHVRASHWFKHGHQFDPAYDNAILHVVYEADLAVDHPDGGPMQTLVVKDRFPERILDRYQQMMINQQWIPCYNQLQGVAETGFSLWAPGLAVERLVCKAFNVKQLWGNCKADWEETFYQHMACSFGFKINGVPFELLAKSLPLKIVRKHSEQVLQLEALFFGQSGLLDNSIEGDYPKALLHEYQFMKKKYNLKSVPAGTWKFLRLRPMNFPTIRISQWVDFLVSTHLKFFELIEDGSFSEVLKALNICASSYWDTHYVFGKETACQRKIIGRDSINLLIINGIVPLMFFFGLEKDQPAMREKALSFLEQVNGEHNAEISRWTAAGLPIGTALHTQALLHLKRYYCEKKRCLDCRIGNALLTH
ncbi:MAG: DUF2851 family protein [Bacteroidota bacterium]